MADLRESIEQILSVAIDIRAPYAKAMVNALLDLYIADRLAASGGVEGWQTVPKEPTEAMRERGSDVVVLAAPFGPSVGLVYRAMLKAAPLPPAPKKAGR